MKKIKYSDEAVGKLRVVKDFLPLVDRRRRRNQTLKLNIEKKEGAR